MTQTNEASTLHKKAASDHEAAAKHHHKAAECHDHNKTSDAKASSKSAMDCCNTAQKNTKAVGLQIQLAIRLKINTQEQLICPRKPDKHRLCNQ